MKQFPMLRLLALGILLSSCSAIPTAAPAPIVQPTPAEQPTSSSNSVVASAEVVPALVSQIAFPISGPVKEVAVKEGDIVEAGQTLILLDTPDLEFSVAGAEAAVRSAELKAEVQRFRRKTFNSQGKVIYLSGPPELRQVADSQLQGAQAALKVAQAALAQGTLAAPYNGAVAEINVLQGEFVQAGQPVITFATLDHLRIETTDLSERDIPKIKIGQNVEVRVEALNQDFQGEILTISPVADTVGGDVVYKVTIELDKQTEGLLWGMSAEVTIGQ